MMRLIFLLVGLLFFSSSTLAADMRLPGFSRAAQITEDGQYFISIRCNIENTLSDEAFSKRMSAYLASLDSSGNSGRGTRWTDRAIREVFHGFILSDKAPSSTQQEFTAGTVTLGSGATFIPLFHGKRLKGSGRWRLTTVQRYRDLCKKDIFVSKPSSYFITPVFMYSDENSQGTVFGNFLRLGLNLVIDGRAKLLNDPVSAESATRINEVKEFVESLENLWLLPAAKISAEEPRRIRAGKYSIRTSMSDVNINVVHANKGYLLGAREIPFSTQGQSIFGVPAEDTVLTTVANAKDACTRYDNDLKEKKGLENAHDRTYLLYKFIFNKTEHMAKIIACLRHDTERLDRYANNNTIIRYVFKNIPESDRDNWLITAEKMRIFENNYSILLPQEDLSATVTEAVKSRLREKVTKLVTDGMGLIRRNASLDAFNAASQGYGRRILEQMFAGSVEVNDASLATALMDQVNPVPRDQPFAILKGLYNHGFERVGCVVSAEKFKADTDAQQQYMGDSLFAFAMFKQALSQRDSEKLDPKKAIIVRPEFFWDGEDFKVSKLALNDSYNRTILSKTICNGKLTPAEE